MSAREITIMLAILSGARGFCHQHTTTEPPCPTLDPFSPCSTNPVTSDGTELVPVATVACGESVSGDTALATPGVHSGLGACGTSQGDKGYWFLFEESSDCYSEVTFDLCTSDYDTQIQVWDDAGCTGGAPACVGGNDDYGNCVGGDNRSRIRFQAGLDRRYYLWVTGYLADAGNFTLDVNCG